MVAEWCLERPTKLLPVLDQNFQKSDVMYFGAVIDCGNSFYFYYEFMNVFIEIIQLAGKLWLGHITWKYLSTVQSKNPIRLLKL